MFLSDGFHDAVQVEGAWFLAWGKFTKALEPLANVLSCGGDHKHVFEVPAGVVHPDIGGELEWVHAKIDECRCAKFFEGLQPNVHAMRILFEEGGFPVSVAQGGDVAIVCPVEELLAWPWALVLECREKVVPIQVDFVGTVSDFSSLKKFCFDLWVPSGGEQGGEHVFVGTDVIDNGSRGDDAGPLDNARDTVAPLPLGVFFSAKHGGTPVRPGKGFGPIIGGVHDDGVFLEA